MAEMTKSAEITLPSDTEILLTRTFDAPARLVWKAMTEPELVRKWWGPRDMEMTSCEIDLRVGGRWRYVQRAADGSEHPFTGEYREISPTGRLSYTWVYDVPPINEFVAIETVSLDEHDGRTTARTLMTHPSKESRDGHINAGMEKGALETMDRLAELLATLQ